MNRGRKIGRGRATAVAVATVVLLLPSVAGAQLARQDFPATVLDSLRTALGVYEEVRAELATDQIQDLPARASRLAEGFLQAQNSHIELAAEISGVIKAAADSAESLGKVKDLAAARAAFGELSRQILLLASIDPRLAGGRHVFACPMVKTFPKWIQPSEALDNPYMGKAMPACGFSTDWTVPASNNEEDSPASPEGSPEDKGASGAGPVFNPGISGLKMVDVRDHKFLWREIAELQRWENSERISIAEFRSKVTEKTAHFLGFGGAEAAAFSTAARDAVAGVRESFQMMRQSGENPGGVGTRFSADLSAAVNHITLLLQDEPRHKLFAPECKKWLLKLAFGPNENKEDRQARAGI